MGYKQVKTCPECGAKVGMKNPKNGTTRRSKPVRVYQKRVCRECNATYRAEQIEGPVVKGE